MLNRKNFISLSSFQFSFIKGCFSSKKDFINCDYWMTFFKLKCQAFGASAEAIEIYLSRGIINWGEPISHFFDCGSILVRQARSQQDFGSVFLIFFIYQWYCFIIFFFLLQVWFQSWSKVRRMPEKLHWLLTLLKRPTFLSSKCAVQMRWSDSPSLPNVFKFAKYWSTLPFFLSRI